MQMSIEKLVIVEKKMFLFGSYFEIMMLNDDQVSATSMVMLFI